MLQNIRDNSQGWIAKTIIGAIILLMALTGFDAIFRATDHKQDAAKVNGDEIAIAELNQAVEMQRRQLLQQLGKDFDASQLDDKLLRDSALKSLIERKLVLQGAKDAGFAFSQPAIDQLILRTPEFQSEGQFSSERFDQVIRQMGYSRLQFRQMLEQEMLIGQLRAGIAGSGFVTDPEVNAFARLEKQTRDFATLTLPADGSGVTVSQDDVKAYYGAHAAQFMSPEQVVLEYVELKKEAFFAQAQVKEEDLQALYQKEIGSLAEQREAGHILIEVNDKQTEAQAKAKIDEIKARIDAGADFAAQAKQFSEDPGSAAAGGNLGFAGPGVYDPAFEKALYSLKKGQVSEPVRTDFGWHLIKLLDVQAPEVPSFASLKSKLEHDLKSQEVEQRFVDVSKQLEDASFEASDLAQPAQELGLKVQTSAPFGREGGEGLAANRQVLQAAFSPEVLEDGANSGVIELDPETSVVIRVKEHRMPEQLAMEQVSSSIREQLLKERATEAAKTKGEEMLASLREGKTSVQQAGAAGTWQPVEAATRNQEGVDAAVLQAVFRMPKPAAGTDKPAYTGVVLSSGSYVLVKLSGVSEPEQELSSEEKASYSRFLASRSGQQDFAAYRKKLEAEAKIERF